MWAGESAIGRGQKNLDRCCGDCGTRFHGHAQCPAAPECTVHEDPGAVGCDWFDVDCRVLGLAPMIEDAGAALFAVFDGACPRPPLRAARTLTRRVRCRDDGGRAQVGAGGGARGEHAGRVHSGPGEGGREQGCGAAARLQRVRRALPEEPASDARGPPGLRLRGAGAVPAPRLCLRREPRLQPRRPLHRLLCRGPLPRTTPCPPFALLPEHTTMSPRLIVGLALFGRSTCPRTRESSSGSAHALGCAFRLSHGQSLPEHRARNPGLVRCRAESALEQQR